MREFFRTEEGNAAWRNPTTDAQTRRLLGALVQPQPESHLKLVLGSEGEILLDSLERRGWVASRTTEEQNIASPDQAPAVSDHVDTRSVQTLPPLNTHEQVVIIKPQAPRLPPMTPPPQVSQDDVQSSLDDFFRKMGR